MAASVLQAAGLSVGAYTSPHLISYTERISVDGTDIPEEDFALAADAVRKAAARIQEDGMEAPHEFELLTAMGFWYFRHKKVDYAVVEVGMGGLLDSTNVVMPVVSVITNVAMDHMKYCGSTLEEIAHHKAGIIKKRHSRGHRGPAGRTEGNSKGRPITGNRVSIFTAGIFRLTAVPGRHRGRL